MGFRVVQGGLLTTVQDSGRTGFQSQGFSVGGVMDTRAFRIANILAGNAENEAALEFALTGPELEFTSPAVIAVTGGDYMPEISGKAVPMYAALRVGPGDVLKFGGARRGNWGYIAFSGGLKVPEVMGSFSTSLRCGIGGFQGRKLRTGDELATRTDRSSPPFLRFRKIPVPEEDSGEIRVVMGPQDGMFTSLGIETFLNSEYTVTAGMDRMGYRLEGPAVELKNTADIISDGIALGAIQISSAGKPIVLMADRQTTGGYAKIATVISVDLPRLVQKRPDQMIRFRAVSVQEAQKLVLREARELVWLRKTLWLPRKV